MRKSSYEKGIQKHSVFIGWLFSLPGAAIARLRSCWGPQQLVARQVAHADAPQPAGPHQVLQAAGQTAADGQRSQPDQDVVRLLGHATLAVGVNGTPPPVMMVLVSRTPRLSASRVSLRAHSLKVLPVQTFCHGESRPIRSQPVQFMTLLSGAKETLITPGSLFGEQTSCWTA
jgi:hypothetical protein